MAQRLEIMMYIVALLIVGAIVLIIIDFFQIKNAQTECVRNPFVYGVRRFSEENNADFSCTCYSNDSSYPSFIVSRNNLTLLPKQTSYQIPLL